MKFLAKREDGTILGRFGDNNLTFPIPGDNVVLSTPTDVLENVLLNGSNLGQFIHAKIQSFISLHPSFNNGLNLCDELILPNCDLAHSQFVTRGPGKTTSIRPGGTLVSGVISCNDTLSICMRYHAFIMGSKSNNSIRYYNYNEDLGIFINGVTDMLVNLVDSVDPNSILESIVYDAEGSESYYPDFRVSIENTGSRTIFISDWMFITKKLFPPPEEPAPV